MAVDDDHDIIPEDLGEYVPVVYAGSVDEAHWYRQLLEDHDIAAVVDEDYAGLPPEGVRGPPTGTPVLVRQAMLEEAGEVIAEMDEVESLEAFGEGADEDEDEDEDTYGLGYGIDDHEEEVVADEDEEEL
jgi:hypothetical protein